MKEVPCGMKMANQVMFVIVNWMELLVFGILYWHIRNIKNELNSKSEIHTVIACWIIFSLVYFSLNLTYQNLINTIHSDPSLDINTYRHKY